MNIVKDHCLSYEYLHYAALYFGGVGGGKFCTDTLIIRSQLIAPLIGKLLLYRMERKLTLVLKNRFKNDTWRRPEAGYKQMWSFSLTFPKPLPLLHSRANNGRGLGTDEAKGE